MRTAARASWDFGERRRWDSRLAVLIFEHAAKPETRRPGVDNIEEARFIRVEGGALPVNLVVEGASGKVRFGAGDDAKSSFGPDEQIEEIHAGSEEVAGCVFGCPGWIR